MAPEAVDMRPLRLSGLDYLRGFHGMGHQHLPGRLRIRLRETRLAVHIVRHGTPEAVKFNVFSRISAGGPSLSRQEIRHAVIPGPARNFLADPAEDPAFGDATDWSVSNGWRTGRWSSASWPSGSPRPPSTAVGTSTSSLPTPCTASID